MHSAVAPRTARVATTEAARVATTEGARIATAEAARAAEIAARRPRAAAVPTRLSRAGAPAPTPAPTAPDDNSDSGGSNADNLPLTGSNVPRLLMLSAMLVAAGVVIRLLARDEPRPRRRATV